MAVMKVSKRPIVDPSRQFQCVYGCFVTAPDAEFFKKYGRDFRDPKGAADKPREVDHPSGKKIALDPMVIITPEHWADIQAKEAGEPVSLRHNAKGVAPAPPEHETPGDTTKGLSTDDLPPSAGGTSDSEEKTAEEASEAEKAATEAEEKAKKEAEDKAIAEAEAKEKAEAEAKAKKEAADKAKKAAADKKKKAAAAKKAKGK